MIPLGYHFHCCANLVLCSRKIFQGIHHAWKKNSLIAIVAQQVVELGLPDLSVSKLFQVDSMAFQYVAGPFVLGGGESSIVAVVTKPWSLEPSAFLVAVQSSLGRFEVPFVEPQDSKVVVSACSHGYLIYILHSGSAISKLFLTEVDVRQQRCRLIQVGWTPKVQNSFQPALACDALCVVILHDEDIVLIPTWRGSEKVFRRRPSPFAPSFWHESVIESRSIVGHGMLLWYTERIQYAMPERIRICRIESIQLWNCGDSEK